MKFLTFLLCSVFLHLVVWFSAPEKSLVTVSGMKAHVLDEKVRIMQVSFSPPKIEVPKKAVKANTYQSQFNGKSWQAAKTPAAVKLPEERTLKTVETLAKKMKTPTEQKVKHKTEKPPKVQPKKIKPIEHLQSEQLASAKHLSKQDNQVDAVVELEKPALFKGPRPKLKYPLKAKRRGYQGVSLLAIELDTEGNIVKLSVVKSSGYKSLDEAAINNVKQWQFHPFKQGQHAVRARFTVPIEFKLS